MRDFIAASRADCTAGSSIATNAARMQTTTTSSIKVNPAGIGEGNWSFRSFMSRPFQKRNRMLPYGNKRPESVLSTGKAAEIAFRRRKWKIVVDIARCSVIMKIVHIQFEKSIPPSHRRFSAERNHHETVDLPCRRVFVAVVGVRPGRGRRQERNGPEKAE
jgi:hypothetical protein